MPDNALCGVQTGKFWVQTHHDNTRCGVHFDQLPQCFRSIEFDNTGPSDGNRRRSPWLSGWGSSKQITIGVHCLAGQLLCKWTLRLMLAWCYSPIEWFRFHIFTKIGQYPSRSSTQEGSVLETSKIISNYRWQLRAFFFLDRIDKPNSCEGKFLPKGGMVRRTDWHWLFPIRAFTPRVVPYGRLWPKCVREDPLKRCVQGWPATSSRWPAKCEAGSIHVRLTVAISQSPAQFLT